MITRSGRVSKAPVRYEPVEKVEDDFEEEDYDSDDSGGSDLEDEEMSDDGSDDGSDLESFIDEREEIPSDEEEEEA